MGDGGGTRGTPPSPGGQDSGIAPGAPLDGVDLYDVRALIVGTLTAAAIITEPGDVGLHIAMLESLTREADFGDVAREMRAGYIADM